MPIDEEFGVSYCSLADNEPVLLGFKMCNKFNLILNTAHKLMNKKTEM